MKEPSIYMIINRINGKKYIGSAKVYSHRINSHKSKLENGKHTNKHLQNAWNKYGSSNFEFSQLEKVGDINKLLEREQYYLDTVLFASHKNNKFYELGYNKIRIAGSNLGYKFTEEGKRNTSEGHKGIKMSEETKRKLRKINSGKNNRFFGKTHTKESRSKISKASKGIKRSNEFKIKISQAFSKPVLQFSIDNKFIKKWNSIREAEQSLKINHISAVCRKERKTAGKYYWRYEN